MHKKYFISILFIPALLVSMESEYTPFLQTQDNSCNEVVIDLSQSGDDFIDLLRPYDKKNFNQLSIENAIQRSLPPELVAQIVAFKLGQYEKNTQKAKHLAYFTMRCHVSYFSEECHELCCSGSFITIGDLLSLHKQFYNLVNDGTSLPDKIYLDLITSCDKHGYYPHPFKQLLSILPQRIRDRALCTASPALIDLLVAYGTPDIDGALEYIKELQYEYESTVFPTFEKIKKLKKLRKRIPNLQLHKPGLTWKQKWYLWNKTDQSEKIKIIFLPMCMLTTGITILLIILSS